MKEDFDWDKIDQFRKDWENYNKVRKEFRNDLIVSVATYYIDYYNDNTDNKIDKNKFIEISKKKLYYLAEEFLFLLSDLLYHYDKKETNFLDIDDIGIYMPKFLGFSELKESVKDLKWAEEYVDEFIKIEKEAFLRREKYLKSFHKLIKKEIVDYLYNVETLPSRAFRELDFICWQRTDDFMSELDDIIIVFTSDNLDNYDYSFD